MSPLYKIAFYNISKDPVQHWLQVLCIGVAQIPLGFKFSLSTGTNFILYVVLKGTIATRRAVSYNYRAARLITYIPNVPMYVCIIKIGHTDLLSAANNTQLSNYLCRYVYVLSLSQLVCLYLSVAQECCPIQSLSWELRPSFEFEGAGRNRKGQGAGGLWADKGKSGCGYTHGASVISARCL